MTQAKDREERRWQQDAEGKVAQEDQWAKDREKGLKVRVRTGIDSFHICS